jgi:glycosyltransferase involved in cell wall biosynthesis
MGSDDMKRVMMIAHPFPPEGSATSFRTLRHVRQLPKMGWSTTVVTALPSEYERYDRKLLEMVPAGTEVIRVKAYDVWQQFQTWRSSRIQKREDIGAETNARRLSAQRTSTIRSWAREGVRIAEAYWYKPDMAMPWINLAVKAAVKVCQHQRPNVIWANAGRKSAFYIAEQVSRHTGVPYVLDFDDAWTITHNDFEARQPIWIRRAARHKMYHLLNRAQAVVFRYHTEAECFFRAYQGSLDAPKIYIIPNGFELPIEEFAPPTGNKCTILYAGVLSDYRYDTLLNAVTILKQTDTALASRLCLRFVGEGMCDLANVAGKLGLSDIIHTSGPRPFAEVAELQRDAHALLVLGRPATKNGYELFAGAKVFGYLKSGRPIVGVLPADETRNVLHRVGARTVADVDSVAEIGKVLRQVIDHWSMGTLSSLVPHPKACEAYSSERQTATLVRALERETPEEPFVPGAQAIPPSLRGTIANEKWLDGAN